WLSHSRNNLLRNRVLRSALGHSLPQRQHRLLHHPRRHSQVGSADASLARQVQCLTCGGALVALQVVLEYLHDLSIAVLCRYNNPFLQSGDGLLDITLPPGQSGATHDGTILSVAERSFSFLDRVKMFVKPMPQPFLHGSRQLQDKVHKTQSLEEFKMASGIHDDMRSTATKLFKRQRLTRL